RSDPRVAPAHSHAALHAEAQRADVSGLVGRATRRALGRALGAVAAFVVVVSVLQPQALLRGAGEELVRRTVPDAEAALANRLARLTAQVVPPAYSRPPEATLENPDGLSAPTRRRTAFGGRGPAGG